MLAPLLLAATVTATPTVVVTTSMLEEAVGEVAPAGTIRVVSLLPPAACPGHFDPPASALAVLRDADLVLRHPFEAALDGRLRAVGLADDAVVPLKIDGALTVPETYASLVEAAAAALARRFPTLGSDLATHNAAARERIAATATALRERAAPLAGVPVIASALQADLCRYLGLQLVATLPRGEEATPRDLERLLAQRPAFVVANLQEGTGPAAGLADRLGVPLAVLSNFPGAPGYGTGWRGLVDGNVDRLVQAWRTSSSR